MIEGRIKSNDIPYIRRIRYRRTSYRTWYTVERQYRTCTSCSVYYVPGTTGRTTTGTRSTVHIRRKHLPVPIIARELPPWLSHVPYLVLCTVPVRTWYYEIPYRYCVTGTYNGTGTGSRPKPPYLVTSDGRDAEREKRYRKCWR